MDDETWTGETMLLCGCDEAMYYRSLLERVEKWYHAKSGSEPLSLILEDVRAALKPRGDQ
jgi:hypothetical protein